MKIFLKQNVLEAALDRIRWVFDEFEHVNVSFSGGKDSTVTLGLTLQVAEELGRLPIPVMFIDQEAEWKLTIDYVREIMADPRVKPYWFQIPFRLFNAASQDDEWLTCWDPEKEEDWVRPREPDSIHENTLGVDRMYPLFTEHLRQNFDGPTANLAGIRCSESPARYTTITSHAVYKGVTWGRHQDQRRGKYNFYPLYDWADSDIWKCIHEHSWPYCKIYDIMYQYGIAVRDMRVSSLIHETAMRHLVYLQEFEGETWRRVQNRLKGVNSVKHLQQDMMHPPKKLPSMFESWREYRDYLLEHLIKDEDYRETMAKQFKYMDDKYRDEIHDKMHRFQISAIMSNDRFRSRLAQFDTSHVYYNRLSKEEMAAKKAARRKKV